MAALVFVILAQSLTVRAFQYSLTLGVKTNLGAMKQRNVRKKPARKFSRIDPFVLRFGFCHDAISGPSSTKAAADGF